MQHGGPRHRVAGTAADCGLDHDGAGSHRRDQSIAAQKAHSGRMLLSGKFADQHATLGDPLEERPVSRRIGLVEATGSDRDRRRPGRQGATMGSRVDTERASGHHRTAAFADGNR